MLGNSTFTTSGHKDTVSWEKKGDFAQAVSLSPMPWSLLSDTYRFIHYYRNQYNIRQTVQYQNNSSHHRRIDRLQIARHEDQSFWIYLIPFNVFTGYECYQHLKSVTSPGDILPNLAEFTDAVNLTEHYLLQEHEISFGIKVQNLAHLVQCLSAINQIERLDDEVIRHVYDSYTKQQHVVGPAKLIPPTPEAHLQSKPYQQIDQKLTETVRHRNASHTRALLATAATPNASCRHNPHRNTNETLLIYSIDMYLTLIKHHALSSEITKLLRIIYLLLAYGANPHQRIPGSVDSALSFTLHYGDNTLVELVCESIRYAAFTVNTHLCPGKNTAVYLKHLRRLNSSRPPAAINPNKHMKICYTNGNRLTTDFSPNEEAGYTVDTLNAPELKNIEFEQMLDVYQQSFGDKNSRKHDKDTLTKKLKDKLGMIPSARHQNILHHMVELCIEKSSRKIIGFFIYEVYKSFAVNLALAVSLKSHRGTRLMSFLIFRAAFIIQHMYPSQSIYGYYTCIHPNSYRILFDDTALTHYPMHNHVFDLGKIKSIIRDIYGSERASQFDGEKTFDIASSAKVFEELNLSQYDKPMIIRLFREYARGNSGIPIVFKTDEKSVRFFSTLYKRSFGSFFDFTQHTQDFAELAQEHHLFKPRLHFASKL